MRKHSARKWLHAILDLLPVLILPIFAIYEINHNENQPISVSVEKNLVVNFNQIVFGDDISGGQNGATYTWDNGILNISGNVSTNGNSYYLNKSIDGIPNCTYLVRSNYWTGASSSTWDLREINGSGRVFTSDTVVTIGNRTPVFAFRINGADSNFDVSLIPQIFNLTFMFGAGNEPSLDEFNTFYSSIYYPYNNGTKQLLKNYETVTYDNTDVGSQMMYSLYKPINEYFNFDNVFTFGAIYDWFELNMFGGNAPMPIYIVWNIIVYQFLMDLIFLVYSVFMFFIDFATDTLERFTGWSRRGC